jgi:hypothetical protein
VDWYEFTNVSEVCTASIIRVMRIFGPKRDEVIREWRKLE